MTTKDGPIGLWEPGSATDILLQMGSEGKPMLGGGHERGTQVGALNRIAVALVAVALPPARGASPRPEGVRAMAYPRRISPAIVIALLVAGLIVSPAPASAELLVPTCGPGVQYFPDRLDANCFLNGYGGVSITVSPASPWEEGYWKGRWSMTLPPASGHCDGPCDSMSAGLDWRTYQPGEPRASAGAPVGSELGFGSDGGGSPTAGGSFSGDYYLKPLGGHEQVVLVSAFSHGCVQGQAGNCGHGAADAILRMGTPAEPPTCVPGQPEVVGAATTEVVVRVKPCPVGDREGVSGYRIQVATGSGAFGETQDVDGEFVEWAFPLDDGVRQRFRVYAYGGGGNGPPSKPSAPAVLPFTSIGGVTTQQWRDFAGRAPTSEEREEWADAMQDNMTPGRLIADAMDRLSWQTPAPIVRLYRAYFLRLPTLRELDGWTAKRRSGTPLHKASQALATSDEFDDEYGNLSNRQFVKLVYRNVVGRAGTSGEIDAWTGRLDQRRMTRGEVMLSFSESGDFRRATAETVDIVRMYAAMLRRIPRTAQVEELDGESRRAIAASLLAHDLYQDRVGTVASPFITTRSLPSGRVGRNYATSIAHIGGTPSLTWSVSAGALPPGLTLGPATGVLSGTPTDAGTHSFTVRLIDVRGRIATKALTLVVAAS